MNAPKISFKEPSAPAEFLCNGEKGIFVDKVRSSKAGILAELKTVPLTSEAVPPNSSKFN